MKNTKKKTLTMILSIVTAIALLLPASVWANDGTFTMPFRDFLFNEGDIARAWIQDATPRQIIVDAPKKYIEQVEVLHKKGNSLAETDISITNIDIYTNGEEATRIEVKITGQEPRIITDPFEDDGIKKKFEIGFVNLNDSFDITIDVKNGSQPLETMIFRVPEGSSNIFKISQKFSYKTAGKRYSLYDLLSVNNLFADLLVEHKLQDIKTHYRPE